MRALSRSEIEWRKRLLRVGVPVASVKERTDARGKRLVAFGARNMSFTEVERHANEMAAIAAKSAKAGIELALGFNALNTFGLAKRRGRERIVLRKFKCFKNSPQGIIFGYTTMLPSRFYRESSRELPDSEVRAKHAFLTALEKNLKGSGLTVDVGEKLPFFDALRLSRQDKRKRLRPKHRPNIKVPKGGIVRFTPPSRAEGSFFRVNVGRTVVVKKPYFDMESKTSLHDRLTRRVHGAGGKEEYDKRNYRALVREVVDRARALKKAGIPIAPLKAVIYRPPRTAHEKIIRLAGKRIPAALVFAKARRLTRNEAVRRIDEIAELMTKVYQGGFDLETKASSLGIIGKGKDSKLALLDLYPVRPENKSGLELVRRSVDLLVKELYGDRDPDRADKLRSKLLEALRKRISI
ncbi:hypothetical protein HY546_00965 [archaeon]|nr:hypothetical protein [archaeon]